MGNPRPPQNLEELLERLEDAAEEGKKVTLNQMMDHVGRRSFGPLLLLAGIIASAPLVSDIPGVPTLTGFFVLLVAGQVLLGRNFFWLPKWLLNCSVSSAKLRKTIDKWLMRPAKFLDQFVGKRLQVLTGSGGTLAIAIVSTLLALASPLTELVPLSGMGYGAAVAVFGLALIARDGLLALTGFVVVAVTGVLGILYVW